MAEMVLHLAEAGLEDIAAMAETVVAARMELVAPPMLKLLPAAAAAAVAVTAFPLLLAVVIGWAAAVAALVFWAKAQAVQLELKVWFGTYQQKTVDAVAVAAVMVRMAQILRRARAATMAAVVLRVVLLIPAGLIARD